MEASTRQPVDQAKLEAFVGRMIDDVGSAVFVALVLIGDRVGLYRALDAAR
jgi:hypothetical protein